MEIEEIIKEKKYFELSTEELRIVETFAKNETEYDHFRSFIMSTDQAYSNKIKSSDGLKKRVFEELHAPIAKRNNWAQSFFLFLMPGEKPIWRYPIIHLATVLILFFTVILLNDIPIQEKRLSLNQMVVESIDTVPNSKNINKEEEHNIEKLEPAIAIPLETNLKVKKNTNLRDKSFNRKSILDLDQKVNNKDVELDVNVNNIIVLDLADEIVNELILEDSNMETEVLNNNTIPETNTDNFKAISTADDISMDEKSLNRPIVYASKKGKEVNKRFDSDEHASLSSKIILAEVTVENGQIKEEDNLSNKNIAITNMEELLDLFYENK